MALTRLRFDRAVTSAGPLFPTNLTSTAGDGQVALSWTAPSPADDVTDYRVQYRTSPDGTWTTFSDAVSTATSATVTGLSNGATYDFQVAPIRSGTVGTYSAPASATPAALAGPSALSAVPGSGQVALSWVAPSPATGVTDYAIQYRVAPAGTWLTFAHAASTATSRTVTGLVNDTAYNFRVAAVRSGSVGDYTAGPATATPAAASTPSGDIFDEHVGFGSPGLLNPTRIVVTSSADSGAGSLRAAIAGSTHKHITFASNMTITVTSTLSPGPNTLIDGRGRSVIIQGTNSNGGFFLNNTWNVTLAHLTLRQFGNLALTSADDPHDAILMYGCDDIWLHHLDISTASDKAVGMQQGCRNVTASWCHFHDQEQTFQSGSDSGGEAVDGVTQLTIHHCYWNGTGYRHPVMSYGKAHIFNNYYRDFKNYGARCQRIGKMHFEKNVVMAVRDARVTLITGTGGAGKDTRSGFLTLDGNVALPGSLTPSYQSTAAGTTFNPSTFYAYTAETANQALANAIVAGVGP